MYMDIVKIILADDEPLFRKGIAFLLQREKWIDVIFEASDGLELINYLKKNNEKPHIIIMDLKMPGLNGVEATKLITEDYPDIKIIALTNYSTKSFIANMISIGAVSYLIKNTTPHNLINTIKEVIDKGFYYDSEVLQIIKEDNTAVRKNSKFRIEDSTLTKREKEVLILICKQNSTREIAEKLNINIRTVEGHRNNLMIKTDTKNVAGLIIFALCNEILSLEELL